MGRGGGGGAVPGAVPSERLWNEAQIRAAVEDTVQGLYEQLEALQVLDGTASSWPGVNQAIADLKETVEYLQEQGRKLVAGKDLAERRAEELRMELLTTASKLEGRERSNEELEQALRVESEAGGSLQERLERAEERVTELEGLLQESRLGNSKLTQETKFLEGELDGLSKELETCRGQLAEAQDRVQELEEESKELKHVDAERRIEVERLTAVIKVTSNESHKMQLENRQFVEDTTRLKHELEAQVRECNDQKQDARASKAEVEQLKQWQAWAKQAEQERFREHREKSVKEAAALQRKISELELECAKAKSAAKAETVATAGALAETKRLQQDAWIRGAELRHLRSEVTVKDGEKNKEKRDREVLNTELDRLRKDVQGLLLDKERLLSQCSVVEAQSNEKLAKALQEANEKIDIAQRKVEVLTIQGDVKQRDLETLSRELKDASSRASTAETENVGLKEEVRESKATQVRLEGELASTSAALDRTIRRIHREAVSSGQEVTKLQENLENLKQKTTSLEVHNVAKVRGLLERLDQDSAAA